MVPDIGSMTTADLTALHRDASGLASQLLDDLDTLHHGQHFKLFWPNAPNPIPDLDAARLFGEATHDLVGGASSLLMTVFIAGEELELRKLPN